MANIDWNAAVRYAKLVELAESIPPAGDDNQLKQKLTAAGYVYLETLYGNELATDINAHAGQIVSFGFLALAPSGELVASIRGTDTRGTAKNPIRGHPRHPVVVRGDGARGN